jgi:hypothetical protein
MIWLKMIYLQAAVKYESANYFRNIYGVYINLGENNLNHYILCHKQRMRN